MKIVISSNGKDLESNVSSVFGRCPYFIIVEVKDKKITGFELMENTSAKQLGGAGVSTAQAVVEKGAEAIITGNLGPRASEVLKQFKIKVYAGSGIVKKAVLELIKGRLKEII